jgi:hypothetical protein
MEETRVLRSTGRSAVKLPRDIMEGPSSRDHCSADEREGKEVFQKTFGLWLTHLVTRLQNTFFLFLRQGFTI